MSDDQPRNEAPEWRIVDLEAELNKVHAELEALRAWQEKVREVVIPQYGEIDDGWQ